MGNSVMGNFVKGMGSISLFPQMPDPEPETTSWQGVLNAFAAANRNLADAIYMSSRKPRDLTVKPSRGDVVSSEEQLIIRQYNGPIPPASRSLSS
jgi:hypothetical protein